VTEPAPSLPERTTTADLPAHKPKKSSHVTRAWALALAGSVIGLCMGGAWVLTREAKAEAKADTEALEKRTDRQFDHLNRNVERLMDAFGVEKAKRYPARVDDGGEH